jgi:endonuclease/exonuclease/phosphatase family metal-dependent hydrolase
MMGTRVESISPILSRADIFSVVWSEMKCVSPTPDMISFDWGARSRRVVTIGAFEDRPTGTRLLLANIHLNKLSSQARIEGIRVVITRIKAMQVLYELLAVTLTADFNSGPNGDTYSVLKGLGYFTDM